MILLFASAMFASALLIFWVQPMFTKAVLPLLGGTPAVWNTALVFFQAALLVGYLYAHLSSRWLSERHQPLLHLGLLVVAALALPIGIPDGWQAPVSGTPVLWLLSLLAVSLGPPFVTLSATAPLLQRWLSTTDRREAEDPYFLYAASNLGSMTALIGYPLLLEPRIGLGLQHRFWSAGYVLASLLVAGAAWATRRRRSFRARDERRVSLPRPLPSTRLRWILLALAPSSLLLGVTTHITTDVAAVPLLWVLPLALYLLTFVLAFSRRSLVSHTFMLRAMPYAAIALTALLCVSTFGRLPLAVMSLHLIVFFALAMVCHGELSRTRPRAAHLTEFYLWIAVGGVLGGALNALVAPLVFDTVAEYPLALVLAVSLAPLAVGERRLAWGDLLWPAGITLLTAALFSVVDPTGPEPPLVVTAFLIAIMLVVFAFRKRPVRLGLGLGGLLLAFSTFGKDEAVLVRERTFFGVNAVLADESDRFHVLRHGTTIHGAQDLDAPGRPVPVSYYVEEGPVGDVFSRLWDRTGPERVAGIGLGTGSIACYRGDREEWTFYEIDPVVEKIARERQYFTFLSECAPDARVVLGDARLSLQRAASQAYDLIVVDVFTSDAIPVHMMTREAFDLYLDKLAPDGFILMNVSNSFLHLRPVVAAVATDLGLAARVRRFMPDQPVEAAREYRFPSEWVVLAREEGRLAALDGVEGWETPEAADTRLWTDDYSNIVQVLRWRF